MAGSVLLGWLHLSGGIEAMKLASVRPTKPLDDAEILRLRRTLIDFFRWSIGSRPDADPEDLAQEVLVRLETARQAGKAIDKLEGYVLGIAQKVRADAFEAEGRRERTLPITSPRSVDSLEQERLQRIDKCLECLKRRDRKLVLEYYEDQGHAKIKHHQEMRQERNINAGTLRGRIFRIVQQIRDCVASGDGCNKL